MKEAPAIVAAAKAKAVKRENDSGDELDPVSVNEMKGKRKSTGSIPAPKKQRLDHVARQPHKFTPKDFKIFGSKNIEKSKENQKGKGTGRHNSILFRI